MDEAAWWVTMKGERKVERKMVNTRRGGGSKTTRATTGLTRWVGGGVEGAVARCGRGGGVVNGRRRGTGGGNLGEIRRK